jgi:hypothetical protein
MTNSIGDSKAEDILNKAFMLYKFNSKEDAVKYLKDIINNLLKEGDPEESDEYYHSLS